MLNGVAKTYAMTGWRVGWMAGPADVVKAATNLQSHLSSNVCNVAQRAALEAVSGSLDAVAEMRAAFDRRRRTIVELLSAIPGVQCPTPRGAFYAYPSVQELIGTELRGARIDDTVGLAAAILEHAEVAVVPGEAFGTPGFLRLSYALADDDLRTGVERMGALLAEAVAPSELQRRRERGAASGGETDAGGRAGQHRLPVHRGGDRDRGDAGVALGRRPP